MGSESQRNWIKLYQDIDLDSLRHDKSRVQKEIVDKVPQLISRGGYAPLADRRVRKNIPFENYAYYRRLLEQIINN